MGSILQMIIKEYSKKVRMHKFDSLYEMDQFLERQSDKIHTRRNR